jgi:hypothetical protein
MQFGQGANRCVRLRSHPRARPRAFRARRRHRELRPVAETAPSRASAPRGAAGLRPSVRPDTRSCLPGVRRSRGRALGASSTSSAAPTPARAAGDSRSPPRGAGRRRGGSDPGAIHEAESGRSADESVSGSFRDRSDPYRTVEGQNVAERSVPVQNGYVSSGTGGHARPLPERWNLEISRTTCAQMPARGPASLTRLPLVMKGSSVRVRASACKNPARELFTFPN